MGKAATITTPSSSDPRWKEGIIVEDARKWSGSKLTGKLYVHHLKEGKAITWHASVLSSGTVSIMIWRGSNGGMLSEQDFLRRVRRDDQWLEGIMQEPPKPASNRKSRPSAYQRMQKDPDLSYEQALAEVEDQYVTEKVEVFGKAAAMAAKLGMTSWKPVWEGGEL